MPIARHKKYSVNVECDIEAPPDAVFDALTHDTSRWDYCNLEMHSTAPGSEVLLRDEDGVEAVEQILEFQPGELFARTENRISNSGAPFETQLYFYLSPTVTGTRVHVEHNGFDDMMQCEEEKQVWIETLRRLKEVCEPFSVEDAG